jgi:hypothetical protein
MTRIETRTRISAFTFLLIRENKGQGEREESSVTKENAIDIEYPHRVDTLVPITLHLSRRGGDLVSL